MTRRQLLLSFLLVLLVLAGAVGGWNAWLRPASASSAGILPSAASQMTFQQFLKDGTHSKAYHGPQTYTGKLPAGPKPKHSTDYSHLLPSAEPPTMKPITYALSTSYLQGGSSSTASPLELVGNDGRLDVLIQPGTFDVSHASVVGGAAPSGPLSLQVSELEGYFVGQSVSLGRYQIQLIDVHGQTLSGVQALQPITIGYHYQPAELSALGLDPGRLTLALPALIAAAVKANTSPAAYELAMQNDTTSNTLSAESQNVVGQPFDLMGEPQNQSSPTLHLAGVQGNSGQLTDSYPLAIAPGTGGFQPQLTLSYTSAGPNERHAATTPAGDVGDGWSLSLGSISEETYGSNPSTMYYFINDIAGVGDRLVPTGSNNLYDTQHISYLRIQQTTGAGGQPCFDVWDKSGTFYEIGCTSTSLQYWTDSNGTRHNYQWDVDKIIAPNEGANASVYRLMLVSYVQDTTTTSGHTTIRDAGMQQIIYGTGTSNAVTTVVGTVDFFYHGPTAYSHQSGDSTVTQHWITAYGNNYGCSSTPPVTTTLRCDDPLDDGSEKAPLVMSTLTLDTVASYVGSDAGSAPSYEAYSYSLSYNSTPPPASKDSPFAACTDPLTLAQEYCAGEHLLYSITPTVYQSEVGHALHATVFGYTGLLKNTYYDSTEPKTGAKYQAQNSWQYLNFYEDLSSGIGGTISWQTAYSNTDGTPDDTTSQGTIDGRYDPLHCATWNDCTGNYAHPDNQAWSEQVVTSISALGRDSSALSVATTTYNYVLAKTGTYSGSGVYCYPTTNDSDCVGDGWIPSGDSDWQDYYHGEYQGFAQVWTSSPAGDLTLDKYYSTEGWYTPWSDYQNFQGGFLYEEDRYSGNSATPSALFSMTATTYADNSNACRSTTPTYPACEVVLESTKTTDYELTTNSSAPYVETDYSYDDYLVEYGLGAGYHNLIEASTYGSNFPVRTQKWSYTTNSQTVGSWTYYTVDTVTHSEVDDSTSHIWQCQNITYDEHAPSGTPTPAAGWPTTTTSYANCAGQSGAITSYTGYDQFGNPVERVDGVAAANSGLYSSNGCTLTSAPTIFSSAWGNTHYTDCLSYDSTYSTLPKTATNALTQTTSQGYTTEELPNSLTDANSLTTSEVYSYDTHGNLTTQITQPGETNSYTIQSVSTSSCATSSTLPCAEIDTNSSVYNTVKSSTFTDSMGRTVETRTPGPGSGYDTIVMTVYNDQYHTAWQSVPFEVAHGSGWVDPNGVTDYQGVAPGGTTSFYDALGRVIAQDDPSFGSGQDGFSCSAYLYGNFTTCTNYGLGSASGDPALYLTATTDDPNEHVSISYQDALGRTVYTQTESGLSNGSQTSLNEQTAIQYNVLNEPTQVVVTDETPQSGQSITSVTTSAQYDDLGRLTQLVDPDRGTHTYGYDSDGRVTSDVSGSRTIGDSYDLLGRLGCVQDMSPIQTVKGTCTSGATQYVVNTYDTSQLGTQGSTDFAVGELTKSVSTTRYSTNSTVKLSELYQHDKRGQLIDEQMSFINLPNSWNVTTALPTYKAQYSYNDANQLTTTTTSTNPVGQGYTSTQTYDSTTGVLTGLNSATATLATLIYNARAQLDTIAFQTSSGTALLNDQFGYDANLRPTTTTATWQSGSGNSGTPYSQTRSYDPASNLITLTTSLPAVSGVSGSGGSQTENFCYDEQNRLVWAGNSGTQPAPGNGTCGSGTLSNTLSGANYNSSYVYTHLGQLWQAPISGGTAQYQYLYCASGQPHQLTGLYATSASCTNKVGQGYTSSYDAWGNVTSRTYNGLTSTLSYDLLDHLTQWYVSSTNQEQYAYDSSGSRVLRRSTNGSTTTLTVYAFGLEDHLYSSAGINQGNTYYYSLAGHLIGALDSSGTTFYLTDALGSLLTSFTNASGSAAVKGEQDYAPYGPSRYAQGTINTAKGYTGQYTDSLTGLDYYGARYYDPVVGVFLSADKTQGNPQGMNPYGYVGGNPETKNDPTGNVVVGVGGQRYYPPVVPVTPDPCTLTSCAVTLNEGHGKETFTLGDLRTVVTDRNRFLTDFYTMFAPGYGQAETDFFNYLLRSGRLDDQNGYWNVVDFQLIRDQLVAAFDFLNHHATQSSLVSNWLAFMMQPSNNGWWTAHNGSIDAADQEARTDGVYGQQSTIQQLFINETIHVINAIQGVSSDFDFVSSLFGPRTRTTGTLASIFYPGQNTDASTAASILEQGLAAGVGGGVVGVGIGALVGGPVGAGVGFLIGASVGLIGYYGFVL